MRKRKRKDRLPLLLSFPSPIIEGFVNAGQWTSLSLQNACVVVILPDEGRHSALL